MKKQMILAALAFAAATVAQAAATESYLYWMVDVSDKSDYAFSYATIKAKDADGSAWSDYLSFYGTTSDKDQGTRLLAQTATGATKGTTTGGGAFSGVGDYGDGSTYLIELWASESTDYSDPSRVAWGEFAYSTVASYICQNMSLTGDSYYTVKGTQLVPEPTSGLLALLGFAALALRRKRPSGF